MFVWRCCCSRHKTGQGRAPCSHRRHSAGARDGAAPTASPAVQPAAPAAMPAEVTGRTGQHRTRQLSHDPAMEKRNTLERMDEVVNVPKGIHSVKVGSQAKGVMIMVA